MFINIENEILEKYPQTEIAYLVAKVSVKKVDPFVENLKLSLKKHVENQGINATNFIIHPNISTWRKIYEEDFCVKPKTYRSSLEALLKRVVSDKKIWNISNIVDLYNCCSILSLLPMGGYDLSKISGDIKIRFAKEKEPFIGLGERMKIEAKSNHVVYTDNQQIICWLWNHKDAAETCIDENTKYVVFFIDSFDHNHAQSALNLLSEMLEKIQCTPIQSGILNKSSPSANLSVNSE